MVCFYKIHSQICSIHIISDIEVASFHLKFLSVLPVLLVSNNALFLRAYR